ncbi:hypothetical protein MKW94_011121 [Papaver nudicaule]|uniref:L-ascorbate oxidase n=1 Tax=Papaver nudicaule TaxID=74823 RepID=A0AA41RU91_PAPNU|nr:hypothetical protein [Papaver nudicaule]
MGGFLVAILCLQLLFEIAVDAAEVRTYDWEVAYMKWSPDCVENNVIGINGQFPGPEIRAKAGDTIVVNLSNNLKDGEGLVLHWHDGTANVSQCAINPGETFVYKFIVDKAGTYFYHGHYEMQRAAGLYGSLIVDVEDGTKEPFEYEGEINLLLSDWWHKSVHEQEKDLLASPIRWIGEPQSILINGRGQYDCSKTTKSCSLTNKKCERNALTVEPKKSIRVRIASTTSLASLNLVIQSHSMLLVEADGNYLQPKYIDNLDIQSGESYFVIINTSQNPSMNYWVSVSQRGRKPPLPPPALAILNYKPTSVTLMPSSQPPLSPAWDDLLESKKFTSMLFLLNTQTKIDGSVKWSVNNVSLVLPKTPYLGLLKFGLTNGFDATTPSETFPPTYDIMKPPTNENSKIGSGVYKFKHMEIVDVILQNANMLKENVSEVHPWHLHGHDFWVLGYGEGKFSEEEHGKLLNLENPPFKNTVSVHPHGWTAIRFVANNTGVWPFHCHIEPHLHMGMGVIFAVAVDKIQQLKIPDGVLDCGLTAVTPLALAPAPAPTIGSKAVGSLVPSKLLHYLVNIVVVISIPHVTIF